MHCGMLLVCEPALTLTSKDGYSCVQDDGCEVVLGCGGDDYHRYLAPGVRKVWNERGRRRTK